MLLDDTPDGEDWSWSFCCGYENMIVTHYYSVYSFVIHTFVAKSTCARREVVNSSSSMQCTLLAPGQSALPCADHRRSRNLSSQTPSNNTHIARKP